MPSDVRLLNVNLNPGWLSEAVREKPPFSFVGKVVLESINFVITPPIDSIPRKECYIQQEDIFKTRLKHPLVAASTATTSSGLTPLWGFLQKKYSTNS